MDRTHLNLLTQGAMVWNSQRPRKVKLSGETLQNSFRDYLKVHWEVSGKWLDNDAFEPESLEEYQENLMEDAANLAGADLRYMNLREYDLGWCNLRGANLNATDLRDSQLVHANLTEARLIGADLRGANLEKAHLNRALLSGALVEQTSLDAAGFKIPTYQRQNLTGPFTGLPSLSLDEWAAIVQAHQRRCAYCGGPYEVLDHLLPLSRGGETRGGNVVPACFVCANARRDRWRSDSAEVIRRLTTEITRLTRSVQPESSTQE